MLGIWPAVLPLRAGLSLVVAGGMELFKPMTPPRRVATGQQYAWQADTAGQSSLLPGGSWGSGRCGRLLVSGGGESDEDLPALGLQSRAVVGRFGRMAGPCPPPPTPRHRPPFETFHFCLDTLAHHTMGWWRGMGQAGAEDHLTSPPTKPASPGTSQARIQQKPRCCAGFQIRGSSLHKCT